VEVSGTLGKMLQVRLRSTDLNDLLPALAMTESNPPSEIPLRLRNGSATADGSVSGPLEDPRFTGQVTVSNGEIQGHRFDQFSGEIDATRMEISGTRLAVSRGATTLSGSGRLTARGGSFDDAGLTAQFDLRNAALGDLVKEAGGTLEVTGTGSASGRVTGSVRRPEAQLALDVQKGAAFGEQIDRLRADAHYLPTELDIANGIANDGVSELRFSGNYRHPEGDLKSGDVSFDVTAQNVAASRIEHVAKLSPPVEGVLGGRLRGSGRIANKSFELTAATADLTGKGITVDQKPIGDVTLTAECTGIVGGGEWEMAAGRRCAGRSHREILAHGHRLRARSADAGTRAEHDRSALRRLCRGRSHHYRAVAQAGRLSRQGNSGYGSGQSAAQPGAAARRAAAGRDPEK
jgi:autotransporter translocation and assembly factor TamB